MNDVNIIKKIKDNINVLINNNRLDEAEKVLKNYENLVSNDAEIYSIYSVINILRGNMDTALQCVKSGLSDNISNSDLLFNLGYINNLKGFTNSAKVSFILAYMNSLDLDFKNHIINDYLKYELVKKYNVILCGSYNKCINISNLFKEWNCVHFIDYEEKQHLCIDLEILNQKTYDFIFLVDKVDKYKFEKALNNNSILKKVYYIEDFSVSVIEGLNYKLERCLVNNNVEGLITGLSYAEVGIKTEMLKYNFCNFALSAQDIYYDFLIFKYLYELENFNKSLKYVIINLAYYSFDYDMTSTISKYRIHRYLNFINKYHNNNDKIGLHLTNLFYQKKNTSKHYIEMNKLKERTILNPNNFSGEYEADRNSKMNYESTRKENKEILLSYLLFLKERNIKPIIVICPTSKYYSKYFKNNIQKNKFYSIINSLKKEVDFQILDYFDCESFNDNDFWDYGHLNRNGSEKFTDIINENIKW